VIGTGTAGAIGSNLNCGDVAVTSNARLHVQSHYPKSPKVANDTKLQNVVAFDPQYVQYAEANFTKLSLDGLARCYTKLETMSGYSFVHKNTQPPSIYVSGVNAVPGPQPMAIVSADFLTVADN
jgi:hypothetical protein